MISFMPETGDVVAFLAPDTGDLILHRIILKIKESYQMKGDNNWESDGIFSKNNLIGYVKKIERRERAISFGLGPEKRLIAFSSRTGILNRLLKIIFLIKVSMGRK